MAELIKLLVVDDDAALLAVLEAGLRLQPEFDVTPCMEADRAMALLGERQFDLVVADYSLNHPTINGLEVLRAARRCPGTLVIIITAFASLEITLESIHLGAYDFLTKPFQLDELQLVVRNAADHIHLQRENAVLRAQLDDLGRTLDTVGQAHGELLDRIRQWEAEENALAGQVSPAAAAVAAAAPVPGPLAQGWNELQLRDARRRRQRDQISAYVRLGENILEQLLRERRRVDSIISPDGKIAQTRRGDKTV